MHVIELNVHPVKSTAIRPVRSAVLEPWGLADDRRWMVVDGNAAMISARTDRRLFSITARTRAVDGLDVDLELSAPGQEPLSIARPHGPARPLTLFGGAVSGVDAGDAVHVWLTIALGRPDVRLVWCADPTSRALEPGFSRPGDSAGYPDGYPVLLTTTASLVQLNDWIAAEAHARDEDVPVVSMQRFRPNIVVDGVAEAFAEDGWRRIRVGSCVLRVVKPCDRCVMTLIDPATLRSGHEPIRSLARHRKVDGVTLFGQNLIPDTTGLLHVGDPVEVLD